MSKDVAITVRVSEESRDNIRSISRLMGVTQCELADTLFELASIDTPNLLEKLKDLAVKNAELSKKRRDAVVKLSNLTPEQISKLLKMQ
jgi:hypothetical protein